MDNAIKIEIEDNGMGIHNDIKDEVFEMFYRGNINSSGTGLGLYITKIAVEKMKGTIEFESTVMKGTNFTVVLPNRK